MKYLILGAGPAGLAFATHLLEQNESDFLILEKEKEAGGLCRSVFVDGSPLDIGGGHFIDVRNKRVLDMLFEVMPDDEWNIYERNSKIFIHNKLVNSPIEANIWQLPIDNQIEYLKSVAIAGCNLGESVPEKFIDWIYWKLGKQIADNYMIPYNQKMFGKNLNILGSYWMEKLPNVSFEETLRSCLEQKAYGKQPGHAQFYYPKKYGSGEVWKRLANRLKDKILYEIDIKEIDLKGHNVNKNFQADNIINTIPWTEFDNIEGIEKDILDIIKQLKYTSISIDYFSDDLDSDAHWIYYPQSQLEYHRILIRKNFSINAKGLWTETNVDRLQSSSSKYRYINKYAYPLNTVGKKEQMQELLQFFKKHNIYGLGRWGEWEHYNSDVVVDKAIALADKLAKY